LKMEQIKCSETSAFNNKTPGKYPKDYTQYSKHGESFKSRIHTEYFTISNLYDIPRSYLVKLIEKNPTRCNNVSTFYYSIFI